ncbi:unnamed protein product [Ascophyllum nodosum]
MKEVDDKIVFAKMDASREENKAFKDKMGIKGFPSFRLFKGSVESASEHRPPRTMPDLVDYFKTIKDGLKPPEPAPAPKKRPSTPLVEPENSEVVVLTAETFDAFLEENKFAVVEFYAPWCGHCKKLLPEYTEASIQLKDHEPAIKFAKVDMTEAGNKPLASKFGVQGYPTLKIFREGKVYNYQGGRKTQSIMKYLKDEVMKVRKGYRVDVSLV